MRSRVLGAAVAAGAAVALLAGCAGSGGAGSATYSGDKGAPPPAPNLSGTLQQYREDEVTHSLKIELKNAGTTTVRVSSLAVSWPGLSGTDPAQVDYDVPPGVTVALKVPYGDAVCTSPTRPTDPVQAEVVTPDSQLEIPLAASDLLLEKLWDQDCARQRLLDAVGVDFGSMWTPVTVDGAPVLRGTLVLTRGSSTGAIDVVDLDGSVLLTLDATPPAPKPLLTMPASAPTAELLDRRRLHPPLRRPLARREQEDVRVRRRARPRRRPRRPHPAAAGRCEEADVRRHQEGLRRLALPPPTR